jgi:protein phosphatase
MTKDHNLETFIRDEYRNKIEKRPDLIEVITKRMENEIVLNKDKISRLTKFLQTISPTHKITNKDSFFNTFNIKDKDLILCCTDGVSNHIIPEQINTIVSNDEFTNVSNDLIKLASENGSTDNMTAVILEVKKDD